MVNEHILYKRRKDGAVLLMIFIMGFDFVRFSNVNDLLELLYHMYVQLA